MSYTEYYDEFRLCQKYEHGNFIMFGADIKNSKIVKNWEARAKLAQEFPKFVESLGTIVVPMKRASREESTNYYILGDFYAFSVYSFVDLEEVNQKFTEFLNKFPFEFHRGKARFQVAWQTKENIMEFPWYYCAPFLEDLMKLKETM